MKKKQQDFFSTIFNVSLLFWYTAFSTSMEFMLNNMIKATSRPKVKIVRPRRAC